MMINLFSFFSKACVARASLREVRVGAVNSGELPSAPHRHTLTKITSLTVELKQPTK
jgi:hypothetical protein